MLDMKVARGRVAEHSAAAELIMVCFASGSVKEVTTSTGLKMVTNDGVSRSELSFLQSSNSIGILGSDGCIVREPKLLSITTSFAVGPFRIGDTGKSRVW